MMDTLSDLELRYDGPIPKEERLAALAGGRLPLALRRARGEMRGWNTHIWDTIACLRIAQHNRDLGRAVRIGGAVAMAERHFDTGRVTRLRQELAYYRSNRKETLRHLIRLQAQDRAERQNAEGIHANIIAPLKRTVAAKRREIQKPKVSLGSISVDKDVAEACKAPKPED